jgi:hypothetical protein
MLLGGYVSAGFKGDLLGVFLINIGNHLVSRGPWLDHNWQQAMVGLITEQDNPYAPNPLDHDPGCSFQHPNPILLSLAQFVSIDWP